MGSNKPRIATYTDEKTLKCFKIISAVNNCSMSEYLEKLIKQEISRNSELLQKIDPQSYVLHRNIFYFGKNAYFSRFSPFGYSVFRLPSLFLRS